jgi:hypothetical protein
MKPIEQFAEIDALEATAVALPLDTGNARRFDAFVASRKQALATGTIWGRVESR